MTKQFGLFVKNSSIIREQAAKMIKTLISAIVGLIGFEITIPGVKVTKLISFSLFF